MALWTDVGLVRYSDFINGWYSKNETEVRKNVLKVSASRL